MNDVIRVSHVIWGYIGGGVDSVLDSYAWLDTGTHASLLDAGNFVRTLTERQGQQVGSPDEVAFEMGWIEQDQLKARAEQFGKNGYGEYLGSLRK